MKIAVGTDLSLKLVTWITKDGGESPTVLPNLIER